VTTVELRSMAIQAEEGLLLAGDPLSGDDYAAMQVVRAYLAEHPADDGVPAERTWMEARGWVWSDFLNFEFRVHHQEIEDSFPEHVTVYLELIGQTFQILSDTGDSPQLHCRCHTRGDIRRLEEMFRLPTKEAP
jgi:hypothetical protein